MISALHALDLAQAAYDDAPDVTAGDCFVILRQFAGATAVSFRGTDPHRIIDLLTDGDATTAFHPALGNVHAGFLRDVEAVFPEIMRRVGHAPIIAIGHSKGGAEASIFAALCEAQGRPVSQLTTFGRARCGPLNSWLNGLAGEDWWNGDDPVPDLPPWLSQPRTMLACGARRFEVDFIDDHMLAAYRQSIKVAVTTA